jgi:Protein of unknown function (DUF4012)
MRRAHPTSGSTGLRISWSDVTTSPNFPSVARVIAQLYPQSGGQKLDGVFAMDVYTLAALMQITGPVTVEGRDLTVTPENALDFMLSQQYSLFEDTPDRIDALEVVALTTVNRMLTSDLPSPPDLADLLSPFVSQQRLVAWSSHPEEEALFSLLRMDGALPDPAGGDGVAVVFNNAGNSKIDYLLDGEMVYAVDTSAGDGIVQAELTVTLHNNAPSAGAPGYVIGNSSGLPLGTNYLYVSVYAMLPIDSVWVDGKQVAHSPRAEGGYGTGSLFVTIPSKESAVLTVKLAGTVDDVAAFTDTLVWRSPPTVRPMPATVTVDGTTMLSSPVTEPGVVTLTLP